MSKKIRVIMLCASLMVSALPVLGGGGKAGTEWRIGEPIVTYWAGPGCRTTLDDRTVAQLKAGGWNLGWAKTPEQLDLYERQGMRAMLEIGTPDIGDPAQAQALEELIGRARTHPALYAYYLTDEPGSGAFPKLGKLVAWLRQRDPAHLAYINLFPTYATPEQLQVTDDASERARVGYPMDFAGLQTDDKTALRYREHLRQFISTVQPDLISYDHYHFTKGGDGKQYFLNLALIRSAALAAKKPFLNIIQACESEEGWRWPNENELRWLTYTSLAYGAQGIAHFRYDMGFWKDPNETTAPVPLYWSASTINREFCALAMELQPLKSIGVYHCGAVPLGGEPLPPASRFAPEPASQDVLLGYFGKSAKRPTHVMVVNLNYKNAVPVTLNGPAAMETFQIPTRTWRAEPGGKQIKLNLPAGGGVLVRVKPSWF